jgi:hypothetical protein
MQTIRRNPHQHTVLVTRASTAFAVTPAKFIR